MRLRTSLPLLMLVLVVGLASLNWTLFVQPSSLNLGFMSVDVPLGLVMLALVGVLGAVFIASSLFQQASVLVDMRRSARELHAQRELADKAEASRFTELRSALAAAQQSAQARSEQLSIDLQSRCDRLEATVLAALKQSENSTAASVGELDDRVSRAIGGTGETTA